MKVVKTSIIPPGGYSYTQPETGFTISSYNYTDLCKRILSHMESNRIAIPENIGELIADQVCKNNQEACYEDNEKWSSKKTMTLRSAIKFTRTLMKAGFKRVTQEEADRRAEICSGCPDNLEPKGCAPCNSSLIKKAIQATVGDRQTTYDSALKSCKHCGCFNQSQIWFPLESLQEAITETENQDLPGHCWKKK